MKVFPLSLGNLGLTWFNQLQAQSIGSFDSLCQSFMDWFVTNTEYVTEIDSLLAGSFPGKHSAHMLSDIGSSSTIENCDPVVSVSGFKLGLTPDDEQVYDD